jgi:molybdate transport system substrate-binding protein
MMKKWRRFLLLALISVISVGGLSIASQQPPVAVAQARKPVTLIVSAAADLNYVFPEIGKLWEQQTGSKVTFNFGSTGQLAQQIERGAPADVFAAANRKFVEDLDQKGLILSNTKKLYAIGRITLWQRQGGSHNLKSVKDLMKPEIKRVAIANPDHAPYGVAAREALQSVGIWNAIQPKLVLGENVRQTQQYAETGNVDVAIVALSISANRPGKWTLIPADLHKPLEQMLAVPKNAPNPEQAKQFAAFINGKQGRPLMRKYGFVLPGEKPVS